MPVRSPHCTLHTYIVIYMQSGHGLCGRCWAQTTQAQVVPYVNLTCKLLRGLLVPVNGLRAGWGEGRSRVLKYPVKRILTSKRRWTFHILLFVLFFWGFLLLNAHKISAKLNYKYGKKSLRDRDGEREGETIMIHDNVWERPSFLPAPLCATAGYRAYLLTKCVSNSKASYSIL